MPTFTGTTLFFCAFWAAAGPLLSEEAERRVEWLLLGLGAVALTAGWSWSWAVVGAAFARAASLCGALLAGALFFSLTHGTLKRLVGRFCARWGARAAVAATVLAAGLAAPLVTAAVAVLFLVEVLGALPLSSERRGEAAVFGCLAVGLGSGMSGLGGPASAVVLGKLALAAYETGPGYLFLLVGPWAAAGVAAMAACAALVAGRADPANPAVPEEPLALWNILVMAGRVFVATAGLVLLGAGLLPFLETRTTGIPPAGLYWTGLLAAVLDNASMAALEFTPAMSQEQIRMGFLGILAAGGAFLAGDAQNLVAAQRLKIGARPWARVGVPASLALMVFFFLSLAGL